jgi:ATP-dependent Clp protease ATP-binding subunit ClpX
MEGATLDFTPEALREVAREALKKNTGARAVRSILEAFMLEHLYDLPGKARGNRFLVTPEVVRREAAPKVEPLPRDDRARPSAPAPGVDDRRESA